MAVIEERERYRVVTKYDEDPPEPYDDGGAPIWRVDRPMFYSEAYADHMSSLSSYVPDDGIAAAIEKWWHDPDTLDRYLRIFHGVTVTERWFSGSYWYFTCDPAHWREAMGLTDEATRREGYGDSLMDEWKAYCEGDVYLVMVQERQEVHTQYLDFAGDVVREYTDTEWVNVESVGGYYGMEWARESALEMLDHYEKKEEA